MILRNDYEFTNRELASYLGVGESYLSNVYAGNKEGGKQLASSLEILFKFCRFLKADDLRKQLENLQSGNAIQEERRSHGAKKTKAERSASNIKALLAQQLEAKEGKKK